MTAGVDGAGFLDRLDPGVEADHRKASIGSLVTRFRVLGVFLPLLDEGLVLGVFRISK